MNLFDGLILLQAATGNAQAASPQGGFLVSFAPLLFVILIFYFLLIRPQQKKQREHQKMLKAVKKGDRILTTGGIYGLIERVREDGVLVVKVADNVKLEMARSAVATLVRTASQEQPTEVKS